MNKQLEGQVAIVTGAASMRGIGWATAKRFADAGARVILMDLVAGAAEGDPACAEDEAALHPAPVLDVPTLVLHGAADGVNHPETSAGKEHRFRGGYERKVLEGVGHFPPREAAPTVTQELLHFLARARPGTVP